jgi:hypothetical protein
MSKLTSSNPTVSEGLIPLSDFALREHFPFGPLPDEPHFAVETFWDYDQYQGNVRPTYGHRHIYGSVEEAVLDYRKALYCRAKKDRPTNGRYFIRRTWRGQEEKRRWGAGAHEEFVDCKFKL